MNIGIDIDNTLTEIQEELNKAAYDYAIKLGKNINNAENQLESYPIPAVKTPHTAPKKQGRKTESCFRFPIF